MPPDEDSDFTFHNVSINTGTSGEVMPCANIFTFHNVSINTIKGIIFKDSYTVFTFHNVSINTSPQSVEVWRKRLYIPQCFY